MIWYPDVALLKKKRRCCLVPSPHAGRHFFSPRGEKKSPAADRSRGQFFARGRRIAQAKSSVGLQVFLLPPSADTARNRPPMGSLVDNHRGKKNIVLSSWGDESLLSEDYVNPHYIPNGYASYSDRTRQNLWVDNLFLYANFIDDCSFPQVIVATDVAETSITIDDVIYVVDAGKHKEKRYNAQKV
ncbi:hypothetical protein GW17_00015196 [Ensete ventricosum]|nr:hypothetical protein GW17_00015196 [Ensete ventricosum]RZR86900.1 hypothetical protein BHM03_00014185 [Ensete ventricosum]